MTRRLLALVAIAVATAGLGVTACQQSTEHRFVIPAGTGERMDRGESVSILPDTLEMSIGDRLVLENNDDRVHIAGPFSVRPGETFDYRFPNAGTYRGICTLNAKRSSEIIVS